MPEVHGMPQEMGLFIFFACPKKTNQKKRPPVSLVPPLAGCPALLDAAGALQTRLRLKQCKSPFRQPLRCSAACQWESSSPPPICPAAPRRRGREKTLKLSEGEARVF